MQKPTLHYLYRRIHRTRKPLLCKYCPLHFSGISRYLAHLRRHESNIKPYWYKNANLPPKAGAKQTLGHWRRTQAKIRKHYKLETNKPSNKQMHGSSQPEQKHENERYYPCNYCGQKFTFPSSDLFCVKHDISRPAEKPSNHYICRSCFYGPITTREGKDKHEKMLHVVKGRYQIRTCRTETAYRGEPSFRCRYCSVEIIKINNANRLYELTHLRLGGTCYEYLQCKQQFQNDLHERILNAAAGAETKVDELLKCKKCEISFRTEKEMKAHERKHDSAKRNYYQCEHCLVHLTSSRIVKLHGIEMTCDNCRQLFNCAGEWQRHKTTSTCEKCNKILICQSEKVLHEMTSQTCVYCNSTLPCGSIIQQHESDSSIGPILSTIFNTPILIDVRCVYCAYCDFQKLGHTLSKTCSYCKSSLPCATLQKRHEQINTCEHCAKYFTCPKQKEDHVCNESIDRKPKIGHELGRVLLKAEDTK